MIRRGLLCAALLLAGPALPAAAQAAAQSGETPEQADTGAAAESGSSAPSSSLRIECATPSRASTLIGKHGCVAGKVLRVVTTHRGHTRIYFCPHNQCSFHATVYAEDAEDVGNLSHLRGRVVVLVGDVTEFHGAPQIVIEDKEQIKVMAGDAPQEFDAAQHRPIKRGRRTRTERAW